MLTPGTLLGPYAVLALIGGGGMGEVYRARDTRSGLEVALKIVPERLASDDATASRFRREILFLSRLAHRTVPRLYEHGEREGTLFAAIELFRGESLKRRLARGPLPWPDALRMAVDVADGLAAIHDAGVIHRDIKPSNLFLAEDGARILDFGMARVGENAASDDPASDFRTAPRTTLGTAGYMSPEQACGVPVDPRSDIFSFGSTLHEALTGRRLFAGTGQVATMTAILRARVPSLADLGVAAPPDLDLVLAQCLAKDRKDRFQSARALASALRGVAGAR
jgi:eukaryotic-like serine/threonine-protein kinase